MATRQDERISEPEMNVNDLWLEETYTDRRVGTIRKMTPVTGTGTPDPARKITWVGETQVMSTVGALPINFQIEAVTLDEAARKFGPSAKIAIERTVRELQEMRRQQASSIVIPQGGLPPGGIGGGGKIQMP
jgi:hypothetical protein